MVSKYMRYVFTSKHYEDFHAGRALVYVSMYQHTRYDPSGYCTMYILLAHCRKGGWYIKGRWCVEGRNIRERELFKVEGRESSAGRLCVREGNVEGKEDIKRRKY